MLIYFNAPYLCISDGQIGCSFLFFPPVLSLHPVVLRARQVTLPAILSLCPETLDFSLCVTNIFSFPEALLYSSPIFFIGMGFLVVKNQHLLGIVCFFVCHIQRYLGDHECQESTSICSCNKYALQLSELFTALEGFMSSD